MSVVTISDNVNIDAGSAQRADQIIGVADVALSAGDAVRLSSDGVVLASGVAFDGLVPVDYSSGEVVTVFGRGARFDYGESLTPGTRLYVAAANDGTLDDSAVGQQAPVAVVVSATDIMVIGPLE